MYGSNLIRFYFMGNPTNIKGIKKQLNIAASPAKIRRWIRKRTKSFYITDPNFFAGIDDPSNTRAQGILVEGLPKFSSKAKAAAHFGISTSTLSAKIKEYGDNEPYPAKIFEVDPDHQKNGKAGSRVTAIAAGREKEPKDWKSFKDKPRKRLEDIRSFLDS